jgi:hypothetical protein
MRYILSLLLSSILFFSQACKKEKAIPVDEYRMTFKKDGISDTLTPYYCSIQPNGTMPSKTDFMLVARSKDNTTTLGITIQVDGNFTTGIYTTEINSGNYPVIADYFVNQGKPTERDFTIDNAPAKPNGLFTVTITSIEDNLVKGTFSCNYLYDRNYGESIVLSDGSFVAKRH